MPPPKKIELSRVDSGHYRATVPLHRVQLAFRNSKALYRGFVAGRGAGKSYVGAYDLIRRALPGRHYLVGSPTGVMMSDTTFPTFKEIAQRLGVWPTRRGKLRLSPYPTVELKNGSVVRFRSADNPERMRGPNLSGVWLDEGSQMDVDAFRINIAALREGGELGWLTCTFTPKGMSHWTYDRFGTGQERTELFHCPTRDNPFLHAEFAAILSKQFVGAWAQQELEGLFVQMEGAEFDANWFGPGIWFERWPSPDQVLLRVLALDPSKGPSARAGNDGVGGDYSAFVLICLTKDGAMWVDADLNNRRNSVGIVRDGIDLYCRHNPDAFAVEINQFQELLAGEFLRMAKTFHPPLILRVWGWNNQVNKEVRIRRLAPILAGVDGRMRFKANSPGASMLVQQLRDFRAPPHPASYHDDGPDSLELGVRMLLHLLRGGKPNEPGGPQAMG